MKEDPRGEVEDQEKMVLQKRIRAHAPKDQLTIQIFVVYCHIYEIHGMLTRMQPDPKLFLTPG